MGEFFALVLMITAVIFVFIVAVAANQVSAEKADTERRKKDQEQKRKQEEMVEAELLTWAQDRQAEGWAYLSRGRLMHVDGQPHCMMSMSEKAPLLRFDEFSIDAEVNFKPPSYLNLDQIASLSVARPTVTRTRKESVPIAITNTKTKSPVARGLVGGALLGPAGLVLGAASGLGQKSETVIENQTVYRDYETMGAPQLIIGTKSMETPVLKIRCADQNVADNWLYRIKARV